MRRNGRVPRGRGLPAHQTFIHSSSIPRTLCPNTALFDQQRLQFRVGRRRVLTRAKRPLILVILVSELGDTRETAFRNAASITSLVKVVSLFIRLILRAKSS